MPDLRGLFLRGHGGQSHSQNNGSTIGVTATTHASGSLGQIQGDALRQIYGDIRDVVQGYRKETGTGALRYNRSTNARTIDTRGADWFGEVMFNSFFIAPTAAEIRPVNMAFRYLIKAMR